MILVPIKLETEYYEQPTLNYVLVGVIFLAYLAISFTSILDHWIDPMVLYEWNFSGIFGHIFLHADFFHMFGNIVLLWLFGNAVNSTIGNAHYFMVVSLLTFLTAASHLLFYSEPAVGVSALVYSLIGFFIFLYPKMKIRCFWWFLSDTRYLSISAYILVLIWVMFDLFGVINGAGDIGYLTHLAGVVLGLLLSLSMIYAGLIHGEN